MPELRQVTSLAQSDLERRPLWVGVTTTDIGMPWYEECDEETFRPWDGSLPVAAGEYILLVAATFELNGGMLYPGFFYPVGENWDEPPKPWIRSVTSLHGGSPLAILRLQQPHVFVSGRQVGFWGGRRGVPLERRQLFYSAVGEATENIFPIRFTADPGLVTGIATGRVDGFYRATPGQPPVVDL